MAQTVWDFDWGREHSRLLLHLQRRVWTLARLAEYFVLFPLSRARVLDRMDALS